MCKCGVKQWFKELKHFFLVISDDGKKNTNQVLVAIVEFLKTIVVQTIFQTSFSGN
jgi:hypothetical protein